MSANEIYGIVSGSHLGDVWLIVSGALRLSLERGVPVFLSRFAYDSESFEVRYAEDFSNLICQCIDAIDLPNAQVIITGIPQNQHHHLDHSFTIPHSAGRPHQNSQLTVFEGGLSKQRLAAKDCERQPTSAVAAKIGSGAMMKRCLLTTANHRLILRIRRWLTVSDTLEHSSRMLSYWLRRLFSF